MMKLISSRKKTVTAIVACIAVVAIAAASLGAMPGGGGGGGGGQRPGGGEAMDNATSRITVDAVNPFLGSIYVTGEFVGTVEPGQQITVYPRASGEVTATYFNVGDTVQAGDVLMEIDSTSVRNSIAQQQANMALSDARAEINLNAAERSLESYYSAIEEGLNQSLQSAQNAVDNARNKLESANVDLYNARRNLRDARSDSDDDSDVQDKKDKVTSAELSQESAQLALEQAEASLAAVQKQIQEQEASNVDSVSLAELDADRTVQQLALQNLQNQLRDYTLTSPINGVIEQRNLNTYEMAGSQSAAFVISNKDAMTVSFSVAKSSLEYIRIGDGVTVEENGQTCTGTITEISTMVDASSGLFAVKATVENAPFNLYSGSMVKIYANTKKAENDVMIPIDAVYYESGEPYVYVYENGLASKRTVEVGISDAQYIQILSGVSLSDRVISTWSSNLMDGVEVTLPGEEQPAAADPDAENENAGEEIE